LFGAELAKLFVERIPCARGGQFVDAALEASATIRFVAGECAGSPDRPRLVRRPCDESGGHRGPGHPWYHFVVRNRPRSRFGNATLEIGNWRPDLRQDRAAMLLFCLMILVSPLGLEPRTT
jgi:hypothetical protein